MNKIVITGPECSGKTTIAHALSTRLGGVIVPEFARIYLSMLDRTYVYEDLKAIWEGQIELESAALAIERTPIISDTGALVMLIWSRVKFGRVDPTIMDAFAQNDCNLYLLCAPEPGWAQDGLRENPFDRWALFYLYHKELLESGHPFGVLQGPHELRLGKALELISKRN
ncbi:MAG: ATP-binding protein [Saprospiraceae bacterium]|nr:ATP-binding protein [Saprospiraceae bacterium]